MLSQAFRSPNLTNAHIEMVLVTLRARICNRNSHRFPFPTDTIITTRIEDLDLASAIGARRLALHEEIAKGDDVRRIRVFVLAGAGGA